MSLFTYTGNLKIAENIFINFVFNIIIYMNLISIHYLMLRGGIIYVRSFKMGKY